MSIPAPLRTDFDAGAMRRAARATKDAAQGRRLMALAEIYDGGTRTGAARIGGVGLQTVRADPLNRRGIRSARGGRWYVSTVQNLLARAEISARIGLARRMQWPGTKPDLANQPEWVT